MSKKHLFIITILLAISCLLSSCGNILKQHNHTYTVWETQKNPTCIDEGTKISYCSCGKIKEQTIPKIEHRYLENICTMCGLHFYETDEYRYNQLKPYADKIALFISRSYINNTTNENYTVEFISEKILERDLYLGYVTEITYTITDEEQLQDILKRTFVLRVDKNLRAQGKILEVYEENLYQNLSSCKDEFRWGEKPTDFSFDFYETLVEPKKVSFYEILTSPSKYANMCIEITDTLYVLKRDNTRSSITVGKAQNSTSPDVLELIYRTGNADLSNTVLTIKDSRVTKIVGHVEFYTIGDKAYIELLKIEIV